MNRTTFFQSGLISHRDGALEAVLLENIDDGINPEIIVTARSAGTGNYLSAYAFSFTDDQLNHLTTVEGLPAEEDPVSALQKQYQQFPTPPL